MKQTQPADVTRELNDSCTAFILHLEIQAQKCRVEVLRGDQAQQAHILYYLEALRE